LKLAGYSKHVYHLCGSPTSQFFFDLSMIYASNILLPSGWKQTFIVVYPNGMWRTGRSLQSLEEPRAAQLCLSDVSTNSLLVPHMFCRAGMSFYRSLFEEILGLRLVGSKGNILSLTADKARTRALVEGSGIKVAKGELLAAGKNTSIPLPCIVKPNNADNSEGLSLVKVETQLNEAIESARKVDPSVLVEEFIPGREIRVAILELDGKLYMPPIIEYSVSPKYPIRKIVDKLDVDGLGTPKSQSTKSSIAMLCPAKLDKKLHATVEQTAKRAHKIIGARHFSLFDFRIDARSNHPVFLEAGLYWSFSSASMITKMLVTTERPVVDIVDKIWTQALFEDP